MENLENPISADSFVADGVIFHMDEDGTIEATCDVAEGLILGFLSRSSDEVSLNAQVSLRIEAAHWRKTEMRIMVPWESGVHLRDSIRGTLVALAPRLNGLYAAEIQWRVSVHVRLLENTETEGNFCIISFHGGTKYGPSVSVYDWGMTPSLLVPFVAHCNSADRSAQAKAVYYLDRCALRDPYGARAADVVVTPVAQLRRDDARIDRANAARRNARKK